MFFLVFFLRSHMGSIRCCTSCWLGFWFQVGSDRGCNYDVRGGINLIAFPWLSFEILALSAICTAHISINGLADPT